MSEFQAEALSDEQCVAIYEGCRHYFEANEIKKGAWALREMLRRARSMTGPDRPTYAPTEGIAGVIAGLETLAEQDSYNGLQGETCRKAARFLRAQADCIAAWQRWEVRAAAQAGTAPADTLRRLDAIEKRASTAHLHTPGGPVAPIYPHDAVWLCQQLRAALAVGAPTKGQAQMELCVQLNAAYQAIDYLSAKVVALESGGAPAAPAPDPAIEKLTEDGIYTVEHMTKKMDALLGAAPGRAAAPEPADDEEARLAVEEAIETGSGNDQRLRHITDAEREALDTYYCAAYETGWVNALAHGVPGGAPPAAPTPNEMSTPGELGGGAARPAEPPLTAWCDRHQESYIVNDCPRCVAVRPARSLAARQIVDEQAMDDGLWFEATTISEAYLQVQLRRLHAAVERATGGETGPLETVSE